MLSNFQKDVSEKLENLNDGATKEMLWANIKTALSSAAVKTIGHIKRKQPDWFDENNNAITTLVKEKNDAYLASIRDIKNLNLRAKLTDSRRKLIRTLRQLKNDWWVRKSKEIQHFADTRQSKAFYDSLKMVFGPSIQATQTLVDGCTGEKLNQDQQILSAWRQHFSKLLNQPASVDWTFLQSLQQYPVQVNLDDPPTLAELRTAIRQMNSGKSAGQDGLPSELFKHGGLTLEKQLLHLIRRIWEEEDVPQDFKDCSIVPLYKGKGSR
ncbi:MAG: hypothetical protein ACRDDF_05875, partial [Aeromonas sp.]